MPSGGLMQLVSYGAEDIYLTGNPQMTFFKAVYKRHTNFAYEWIPVYFDPTLSFSTTDFVKMTAPLPRQGDLVRDTVIILDLPAIYSSEQENFRWIKFLGQNIFHYIDLIIAGQRIDRNYGQWFNIWSTISKDNSNQAAYLEMIGMSQDMISPAQYYGSYGTTVSPTIPKRRLHVPLEFFYTEHPGLSLPLIAIQYVEVRFDIEFTRINDWFTIGNPAFSPNVFFSASNEVIGSANVELRNTLVAGGWNSCNIFWKFVNGTSAPGNWGQAVSFDVKYTYLDTPERRLFAAAVSEYLITQTRRIEFTGLFGGNELVDLTFFHPVKEMLWVFQRSDVNVQNDWNNYTTLANSEDMEVYLEKVSFHSNLVKFGVPVPTPLGNIVLPSGMTITQFRSFIKTTDTLNQIESVPDCFDQVLNIFYKGKFIFNGHDRQAEKTIYYYQYQEPYALHDRAPGRDKQIYVYSFAESPESIQPSGTANFSRLNDPQFQFTIKSRLPTNQCATTPTPLNEGCYSTATGSCVCDPFQTSYDYNLFFYVRNVNILRIMNGIAGLVFAD